MIVVFAEIWPGGDESQARPLGSIGIANESDLNLLSDYSFTLDEAGNANLNIPETQVRGLVQGHNRNQSVWKLVRKVIDAAFPTLSLV